MGEARLQRVRRIYRRLESLAAFNHGHRTRRNVRHHEHLLRYRFWRRVDAEQQMVRLANQRGISRRPRLGLRPRFVVRQMAAQCWRIRDVRRLRSAGFVAAARPSARRIENLSAASTRAARDVDLLLLQHLQQARGRRTQRI